MGSLYVILLPLAAIIGLVVAVSHYLKLDPMIAKVALGVGAFAALIVTLVALIRRIRAPRGGAAADPQVDPAKQARRQLRAQLRREDREMKRRLGLILPELRAADRELRARGLADRPWWMVLGTDGHGKSSLLAAAPGAREIAPAAADQPRFFCANAGVFCELPADYAARPAAAAARRRLHRALRAARVDRPIAGILLVRSAGAMELAAPEAAAERDLLRRQIDALSRELRVRAPLTLIVTKLDQIPGLSELCLDREHVDLDRALGVTLDQRAAADAIEAAARARFGAEDGPLAWIDRLCHVAALRSQAAPERQARLYSLWQRLHELSRRAASLVAQLAAEPLPGGDPLPVRAIYFTCAEGQLCSDPDPVYDRLARELGGATPPLSEPPASPPARAFVAALFDTELPRDAAYSARSDRRRRRALGLAAAAAAILAAAVAAVGATRSAAANRELLLRTAKETIDALTPPARQRTRLRPALDFVRVYRLVELWRAEAPPSGHGWGLFRGDIVAGTLIRSYRDALCRGALRPLAERSEEQLRRFARDYSGGGVPTRGDRALNFDHLRRYLLLSLDEAQPADEPAPWGGEQQTWLIDHLTKAWSLTEQDRDGPAAAPRAALLSTYAALIDPSAPLLEGAAEPCLRSRGARALPRDGALVQRVRVLLGVELGERAAVERLIDEIAAKRLPAVTLISLTEAARIRGRDQLEVPGPFTESGWLEFSRLAARELAEGVTDQAWVLDRQRRADDHSDRCARLTRIYIDRYEAAWRAFFLDLRLDSPGTLAEARAIYRDLLDDKPLGAIFGALNLHTQDLPDITCNPLQALAPRAAASEPLDDNARALASAFDRLIAFAVAPKRPPKGGAGEVKLGIDRYHQQIQGLFQLIDQAIDNSARLGELMSATDAAIRETNSALKGSNLGGWEGDTSRLLLPPLEGLALILGDELAKSLNREWCEQIVLPLRRDAAGRYPFDRAAREHAQLSALRDLFHPRDGAIARFRDERLSSYVVLNGDRVEAKELGVEAPRRLTPAVIELLRRAHQLGVLLFPEDDAGVDFHMDMTCDAKINKVALILGKATYDYDCSIRQRKEVHWPGEGSSDVKLNQHSTLSKTDTIERTREFGLFQLFEDEGAPKLEPNGSVLLTFTRKLFGTTTVRLFPKRSRGGTIFFGFGGDRFLDPFRVSGFVQPPSALFAEQPFACGAQDPL